MNTQTRQTILAVDTATEACSAALLKDGKTYSRYEVAPQKHNTLLFDMCRSVFDEAGGGLNDIHGLAFGRGPGAFTGVRIAAAFVQGIAYARSLPVVSVSSLRTVAQRTMDARRAQRVFVAMDARMEEVYYACYQRDASGLAQPLADDAIARPQRAQLPEDFDGVGAGSGWKVARDALLEAAGKRIEAVYPDMLPDAATILKLALPDFEAAKTLTAEQALPVYLRDPVA